MKTFKDNQLDQKGQAIFEMILFLPFLLFLYTIYYTAGNSINGSINQQKAVRGYFYSLMKNNSYVLSLQDLRGLSDKGLGTMGFFGIGFTEKKSGNNQIAPCFSFSSLLKNGSTETCEEPSNDEPGKSRFVRLFTYYGVCGPMYVHKQSEDFYEINQQLQSSLNACILDQGH